MSQRDTSMTQEYHKSDNVGNSLEKVGDTAVSQEEVRVAKRHDDTKNDDSNLDAHGREKLTHSLALGLRRANLSFTAAWLRSYGKAGS